MSSVKPDVTAFVHQTSSTITYLVADPATGIAAVIDAAADFDIATGVLNYTSVEEVVSTIRACKLKLAWILETHVHADHVSAAQFLKDRFGGRVAISSRITDVQETFAAVYCEDPDFPCDGSQFDHLFEPNEVFQIGSLQARAIATPGHTPACMSYLVGDAVFVGDSIFMPDSGTARCDFPGGSAETLYRSARLLLALPERTRMFVGHDYGGEDRGISWESSVGRQKENNKHVRETIGSDEFVVMRRDRDGELGLPGMIIPAIQINMRAGRLPDPAANGVCYLKTPINAFPGAS